MTHDSTWNGVLSLLESKPESCWRLYVRGASKVFNLIMTKQLQMMQSRDTKNLNLDKDFEDTMRKVKQIGWNESTRTTERRKMQISSLWSCVLKDKMEGMMTLVAKWFSFEEMKPLQGVCMLTSVWAREWQYTDFLSDLDDQVWRDLSEVLQKYLIASTRSLNQRGKFPTGMI